MPTVPYNSKDFLELMENAHQQYKDTVDVATHGPVIQKSDDGNKYWYTWDVNKKQYVNTGVAVPEGIISNPNLLDNWYFIGGGSQQGGGRFPINQRAETSYTYTSGGHYTIDRYKIWQGTVTVKKECCNFTSNNSTHYKRMTQNTELSMKAGETYTISALAKINSVSGNCFLRPCSGLDSVNTVSGEVAELALKEISDNYELFTLTFTVGTDVQNCGMEVLVYATALDSIDIDMIAWMLEPGSAQHLAHLEGDTWVLNTPAPNYTLELMKCYRYLQPLAGAKAKNDDSLKGFVYYSSDFKTIKIDVPYCYIVPMRANPTIINYDGTARMVVDNPTHTGHVSPIIKDFDLSLYAQSTTRCNITASKTSETAYDPSKYSITGEFDFLNSSTTPLLSAEP